MDAIVSVLYWVKLALLVAVAAAAVVSVVRASGPRVIVRWRLLAQAVLAVAVFVGVAWVTGSAFSVLWATALVVLGAVVGLVAARGERTWVQGPQACARRSPLGPALWALALVLAALTLLFGSSYLFAAAMLVLAFALGVVLGQVGGELAAAARPAREAPPAEPAAGAAGAAPPRSL